MPTVRAREGGSTEAAMSTAIAPGLEHSVCDVAGVVLLVDTVVDAATLAVDVVKDAAVTAFADVVVVGVEDGKSVIPGPALAEVTVTAGIKTHDNTCNANQLCCLMMQRVLPQW